MLSTLISRRVATVPLMRSAAPLAPYIRAFPECPFITATILAPLSHKQTACRGQESAEACHFEGKVHRCRQTVVKGAHSRISASTHVPVVSHHYTKSIPSPIGENARKCTHERFRMSRLQYL